jgi:hypothetical protein
MIRQASIVSLLLFATAPAVNGADKIVGATWEVKFAGKEDGPTFTFRATNDGKVYDKGAGVIGTWKGDKDKAEIEITGLREARFNGTYVITNISTSPRRPRWSGKFTSAGGGPSRDVAVRLLRD